MSDLTAAFDLDPTHARLARATPHYEPVERLTSLSRSQFLSEYAAKNRPFVLTNTPFWEGESLTPALLARMYGKKRFVEFESGFVDQNPFRLTDQQRRELVTLDTYLERLAETEEGDATELSSFAGLQERGSSLLSFRGVPYLGNIGLRAHFPELHTRLFGAPCFSYNFMNRNTADGELFIGPRGTSYGMLHFDRYHLYVVTYQMFGRKAWRLFPPKESAKLYPQPGADYYPHYSPIDPDNADPLQYPEFGNARGQATVLEAGDLMFCPASWWHHTNNISTSISIAVRFLTWTNLVRYVADRQLWNTILGLNRVREMFSQ